ncbi:MAG: 2-oxo acid dehydrogenase subunit E2 [Methylacidiphilales bacterium]|nr:2-oxo acid dehydrogenase subunit E2 [Candidatus Methylacidiphilales bacterium]
MSGDIQTFNIPNLGDFKDVEVIELLVKVGDTLANDQTILTLESEKAAMEIPSPCAGILVDLLIKKGDKVSTGTPFVKIQLSASSSPTPTPPTPTPPTPPTPTPPTPPSLNTPTPSVTTTRQSSTTTDVAPPQSNLLQQLTSSQIVLAHASPSVRKLARELGINLMQVKGTGANNRILHNDLTNYVKIAINNPSTNQALPLAPEIDFSQFGPIHIEKLTSINQLTAKSMLRSWTTIPHVTQFEEARIDTLNSLREYFNNEYKKENIKVTFLTLLIKSAVNCLKQFPRLNASLSNDLTNLTFKNYYHIGIAVDTEQGLTVPVIKDCDKKSIKQIAIELLEISAKARARKLSPQDLKGASFTISSLGGIGGKFFTPIINPPEVAILGISKSFNTLTLLDNGTLANQTYLPLSLSYDHRVIDGALAAKFTSALANCIEQPWLFIEGEDKNQTLKKFIQSMINPTSNKTKSKKKPTKRKKHGK